MLILILKGISLFVGLLFILHDLYDIMVNTENASVPFGNILVSALSWTVFIMLQWGIV